MDEDRRAKLIFDRWRSTLVKKSSSERETSKAQSNIEELFYEMSINHIDFDIAQGYVSQASAAQPTSG